MERPARATSLMRAEHVSLAPSEQGPGHQAQELDSPRNVPKRELSLLWGIEQVPGPEWFWQILCIWVQEVLSTTEQSSASVHGKREHVGRPASRDRGVYTGAYRRNRRSQVTLTRTQGLTFAIQCSQTPLHPALGECRQTEQLPQPKAGHPGKKQTEAKPSFQVRVCRRMWEDLNTNSGSWALS